MIRVILTGHCGAMGKNLIELIESSDDLTISAGIDRHQDDRYDFPQFSSFEDDGISGDVIVDFSHFSLVPSLLDFCERTGTPAVICTTGLTNDTLDRIQAVSKKAPLFKSGNMSLGINLMLDLVKRAAAILEDQFDVEIIEKHHNRKVDAPSGTAKMIAEAVATSYERERSFVYGREGNDTKRQPREVGIHAVRGGTIVGEHTAIFAGTDEIIEITHKAASKKVFAKGALAAARFLTSQEPGLYNMDDIL